MLKILHIAPGLKLGGAEAVLKEVVSSSTDEFTHIVVSLTTRGVYCHELQRLSVKVIALEINSWHQTISGIYRLAALLRAERPDVVQCWMYHANVFGGLITRAISDIPVIWSIHGPFEKSLTRPVLKMIIRSSGILSTLLSDRVVCPSKSAIRTHEQIGFSRANWRLIRNGCNLKQFTLKPMHNGLERGQSLQSKKFHIGVVARYDPYKDHETLFSALEYAADRSLDFTLTLVGNGMNDRNHELVRSLEKRSLLGMSKLLGERRDINQLMHSFDILVLPSVNEAFPVVLLEAMATGTPCVTTNVGDSADILGNLGWICKKRDPNELCTAILDASAYWVSKAKWRKLQVDCRSKIATDFSSDRTHAEYTRLWREVS